jgi:DNA-binding response OmpR family regulator
MNNNTPKRVESPLTKEIDLINTLIVGEDSNNISLLTQLKERGYICKNLSAEANDIFDQIFQENIDIILASDESLPRLSRMIKQEKSIPIIGIFSKSARQESIFDRSLDDFIIKPFEITELELRIKRILKNSKIPSEEILIVDDLVIDLAKFEVSVGGKLVFLTFKEFELLKFLANNRGRVFTRDVLLNKVWGIDYFGGDRTVDVHIRRLRSKIEDADRSFIETVRSIGYRFKE